MGMGMDVHVNVDVHVHVDVDGAWFPFARADGPPQGPGAVHG